MFAFGLSRQSSKAIKLGETLWRGTQPAWVLSCEQLKIVLTKIGLNIASISHIDDKNDTNPLWVPKWPWSSPHDCPHLRLNKEMSQIYGNREDSQLLANICGHNVCMDRFGLCKMSDEPRTCHGEASVIDWDIQSLQSETMTFSTQLPLAKLNLCRTFLFDSDRVYVCTSVANTRSKYDQFFNVNTNDENNENNNDSMNESFANINNLEELTNVLANDIKKELFNERASMSLDSSYYSLNSSFLSLPKNKRQRKKLISKREAQNMERTYHIVHGMIEQELKEQFNFEAFKMKKFDQIQDIKQKIINTMSQKMNTTSTDPSIDPNIKEKYLNKSIFDENNKENENNNENEIETETQSKNENGVLSETMETRYDVEWAEHVTLGDPFLDGIEIDTNCDQAWNFPQNMEKSRFSEANGFKTLQNLNVNECLAMPKMDDRSIKIEEATAMRVKENQDWGIFIAKNRNLGFELEYTWETKTWPWMTIWTEHYARDAVPWNGIERTRGLEFTTKPFPIPELEKELPKDRLTKDSKSNLVAFDGTPIQLALPQSGLSSTFSFRWTPL